jgi:hypothetical protein
MLLHTAALPMARYSESLYPILTVFTATAVGQFSKAGEHAPGVLLKLAD